ncbi:hypothetical protein T03_6782 [Trichinella britovi]|uniref:Uncharacterized protein n=1 Tax=Trichinella britovi TaxID=45882 RepID=A0A0V1D8U8_TRIBR|nr:hypothetical protein T03_6782 [Trichinella britovi]
MNERLTFEKKFPYTNADKKNEQCKASWRNISSFRLKIAYQGQRQLLTTSVYKLYNQPPTRIQLTYDNAKVLTGKWPSYGGDRTDLCHCLSASVVTYGQHCSQTTDVLLFYFGTRTQVPPATCIQSQSIIFNIQLTVGTYSKQERHFKAIYISTTLCQCSQNDRYNLSNGSIDIDKSDRIP